MFHILMVYVIVAKQKGQPIFIALVKNPLTLVCLHVFYLLIFSIFQ